MELIEVVVVACLVAAGACLIYALVGPSPDASAGGMVAAILLIVLAAATALIDEKVASADGTDSRKGSPEKRTTERRVLRYPFEPAELTNFAGRVRFRGRPEAGLCLVSFYDRDVELGEGRRSYKWWTSCREARKLETITEIRDKLALLPEWGARDAEAIACVPAGAKLAFLRGTTGPQKDDGRTYPGGAVQYRVLRFNVDWIDSRRRLPEPPAKLPEVDPQACEP